MKANSLIKSLLHFVAAALTLGYAFTAEGLEKASWIFILAAGISFTLLIFLHKRVMPRVPSRTSILFILQSVVLGFIAWNLYQQGFQKSTFLYEGISVLFLSLSAFVFLLKKKPTVFLNPDEQQEIK